MYEDDNEDLSKLDRGDNPEPAKDEKEKKAEDTARDDAGRFAKKDDAVAEKHGDEAEGEENDEDDKTKRDKDEEDAAGEQEEEDDDDDGAAKDKQNFPYRLNKAKEQRDKQQARADAAEARLREIERQIAERSTETKPKIDPIKAINDKLETLYEQVEEARADGKTKDAARIQREIDAHNREISKLESTAIASRTSAQVQLDAKFDAMLDVVEAAFPALVKGSDEYDPELVKELNFQVTAHEKMGMDSPDALRKAVKLIMREDPFAPRKKEEVKPDKKEAEAKKPPDKKTDVGKAAETTRKQPPDVSGRGVNKDDTKIDPARLSDEDWDKLPDSKKRELRGDFAV